MLSNKIIKMSCNTNDILRIYHLTTITVELGFLGKFVLLLLKTCSLYHENLVPPVLEEKAKGL